MAVEKETITQFRQSWRCYTTEEANNIKDFNHCDLPFGFDIHHSVKIVPWWRSCLRTDLFRFSSRCVLRRSPGCLSASPYGHCKEYPEKGHWVALSCPCRMRAKCLYMQVNCSTICTTHSELQYYLSLLDEQLPIQSPFASKLAGNLNAKLSWVPSEIVTRLFNAGIHLSVGHSLSQMSLLLINHWSDTCECFVR